MKEKHLSVRLDEDLLKKLRYVAKQSGCSGNGHILYLIRRYIEQFEEQNGEIELPPED